MTTEPVPPPDMAAKRILLVDDQEDIRLLLRLALAPLGAELLLATNGAEALRMAQERRPDVIILDVMMPGGLDGYQVCRSLRAETTTPRPLIVLLSAKGQQRDIEEGLRAGADHYMLKPFSPLELNDLIMRSQTA